MILTDQQQSVINEFKAQLKRRQKTLKQWSLDRGIDPAPLTQALNGNGYRGVLDNAWPQILEYIETQCDKA